MCNCKEQFENCFVVGTLLGIISNNPFDMKYLVVSPNGPQTSFATHSVTRHGMGDAFRDAFRDAFHSGTRPGKECPFRDADSNVRPKLGFFFDEKMNNDNNNNNNNTSSRKTTTTRLVQ